MESSLDKSESAILARALDVDEGNLTPELAQHILGLGLTEADKQAASSLAKLAKDGSLTDEQASELENYRRAGRLFELLKSKARLALKSGSHSA